MVLISFRCGLTVLHIKNHGSPQEKKPEVVGMVLEKRIEADFLRRRHGS
ncbi:hypothetical protein [uncultured Desulfosarcina sp.]|nr:hypothetical protein [uncultured Desulfosarcina sp.]